MAVWSVVHLVEGHALPQSLKSSSHMEKKGNPEDIKKPERRCYYREPEEGGNGKDAEGG